jgi:hypothetical protein
MNTQTAPKIGMRYGNSWLLRKGRLFKEDTLSWVEPPDNLPVGVSPGVPSMRAAVEGIQACYTTHPVMGSDPEFFLRKEGQTVPAFDFLPDKHASTDGLFWDGFQAETVVDIKNCGTGCPRDCTVHDLTCHALLAQRIGAQMQRLSAKALDVAPQSVWRVPDLMLQLASDAHVSLGCDPSRNAYASSGRLVEHPRDLKWRFAGGHVHFALPEDERQPDNIRYLVKTLDALLGIPSVCFAQNYDHFIRRRFYGLAGEYRLPPHGLEYRTLSNFWLMHPRAFMLVFDLARHALNIGRARLRNVFTGACREGAIRDTINYCDVRSARDFMRLNREFYSAWALMLYNSDKAFWAAIEGGMDKVIGGWGLDVVQDWRVGGLWIQVPAWKDLG